MSTYGPASRSQWFSDDFSSAVIDPDTVCVHSTETTGWPGYAGGSMAPNYTGKPDIPNRRILWRAHFHDEESSRALANVAGGVQTNTRDVIQVELIGTCDPKRAVSWPGTTLKAGRDYLYLPEAPEWYLEELAKFAADMKRRHGIPLTSRVESWRAYPDSYGPTSSRLTFTEWNSFTGWCGHQHVPENNHGDPGNFPIYRVLKLAGEILAPPPPPPPPPPQEEDMALTTDDVRTILTADIVKAPAGHTSETNPTWTMENLLRETFANAENANIKALHARDAAEAAQVSSAAAEVDAGLAREEIRELRQLVEQLVTTLTASEAGGV